MPRTRMLSEKSIGRTLNKLNRIIPRAINKANLKGKLVVDVSRKFEDEIAISFCTADYKPWFSLSFFTDSTIWHDIRGRFAECMNYDYIEEKAKELNLENADVKDVETFSKELLELLNEKKKSLEEQKPHVLVADASGEIREVLVREIINHEESIIEDNIAYAWKYPDEYSEKDINKYNSEARHELKVLKKTMREHPYSLFGIEQMTERYKEIIVNESGEPREYSEEEAKLAVQKLNERGC